MHRKQEAVIKPVKALKPKPNHKQGNQSKSNIHKQCNNQCSENIGGQKHKGTRSKKAETGGAGGDLRSRRGKLGLKSGQKG